MANSTADQATVSASQIRTSGRCMSTARAIAIAVGHGSSDMAKTATLRGVGALILAGG